MHIKRLHLTQFRNYESLEAEFVPGLNCLVGPNGAGKTNVLDALHFLAFTRGFRGSSDQQAVQEGSSYFQDEAWMAHDGKEQHVQCNFVKSQGKRIIVDRQPLSRMSDHIGSIPLVAILPDDTELINGPAQQRRRFLDMLISQYDREYLEQLIRYEKVLAQRNAVLRRAAETGQFDPDELAIWDEQLISAGQKVYSGRATFVEEFAPVFTNYFHLIISDQEEPQITYRPKVPGNTQEDWEGMLQERLARDRGQTYTTGGVHRDDLIFSIDGRSLRHYGSQGQQKTFIIALKLAQYHLLADHTGKSPILLLDDIFDKLDETRLRQIASLLDQEISGQIFITDTSRERLELALEEVNRREMVFFAVGDGKLNRED